MSNVLLGTPIYSDVGVTYTPALSGGSWSASLPLTNLQDRRLAKVARSSDALAASTTFDTDLGVARAVRLLALCGHNLSSAATVRFRGYSDAGYTVLVYDSGTNNAWSSGVTTAEGAEGYSLAALHVTTAAQSARYWRTEITDTGNAAGYVQVGRLVIAGGFQPTINQSYGLKLGWEDDSVRTVTDGGPAVYQAKAKRRHATFTLLDLPETEILAGPFDMMAHLGTTKQLFYVHDPEDTTHLHRRAFLAVMREISPLEMASLARYGTPIALVEEL